MARHGTVAGYSAGCHCERCRHAIRDYRRRKRAERRELDAGTLTLPERVATGEPNPSPCLRPSGTAGEAPGATGPVPIRLAPLRRFGAKPIPAPEPKPKPRPDLSESDAYLRTLREYVAGHGPSPTQLALKIRPRPQRGRD
jgi:hypothetical protein